MLPTKTEPIQPMIATVVGTGNGLADGTVATTPHEDQPNVVIRVVTPLVAILVRAGNTFCVSLAGTLTAGGLTSKVMPHADVAQLWESAVFVSACIAGVGLVKDAATVFSGLEKKFPLASGSV